MFLPSRGFLNAWCWVLDACCFNMGQTHSQKKRPTCSNNWQFQCCIVSENTKANQWTLQKGNFSSSNNLDNAWDVLVFRKTERVSLSGQTKCQYRKPRFTNQSLILWLSEFLGIRVLPTFCYYLDQATIFSEGFPIFLVWSNKKMF